MLKDNTTDKISLQNHGVKANSTPIPDLLDAYNIIKNISAAKVSRPSFGGTYSHIKDLRWKVPQLGAPLLVN